tara:strand:+ start:42 stop:290 length:249 start_codon:yes stop_codon:yes gene_type:complete
MVLLEATGKVLVPLSQATMASVLTQVMHEHIPTLDGHGPLQSSTKTPYYVHLEANLDLSITADNDSKYQNNSLPTGWVMTDS